MEENFKNGDNLQNVPKVDSFSVWIKKTKVEGEKEKVGKKKRFGKIEEEAGAGVGGDIRNKTENITTDTVRTF